MLFPIMVFNERIIMSIINILQTFAKQLGFSDKIVCDKVIMISSDLFTIKNITQILFQHQIKHKKINRFD